MTKIQCMNKIRSCVHKEVKRYLIKESERLLNSGAVDLTKYGNDYMLSNIILTVATMNLSSQHSPYSKESKEEVKNLLKF